MAQLQSSFKPIILGSDINAYGIARSFYEAYGVSATIVCKKLLDTCEHTKYVDTVIVEQEVETQDVFMKTLEELAASRKDSSEKMILVPCGDSYSELMARNKDELSKSFVLNIVDGDLHRRISRKESFYELCKQHGLAYPKTWVISADSTSKHVGDMTFPVILKPANSVMYWATKFPGKRKVFMARNQQEYEKIVRAIYDSIYTDLFIVQEFIPGDLDGEFHFYSNQHKKATCMLFSEIILGSPTPEGIGSHTAETTTEQPELVAVFRSFLDAIGYRGFGNVDLRYDERDNQWKVFEINLRPGRCSYALTASGNNLAELIVNDMIYDKKQPFTASSNKVLNTLVSDKLLKKYAPQRWQSTINELISSKQYTHHYLSDDDINPRRIKNHLRHKARFYYVFKKYFGKQMITDID